jgi:uncharacterized protein
MNLTTPGEHDITLQGLQGALEGRWQSPTNLTSEAVLIICHPHSLHGGSMNNKVVTSIARAARDLGLRSLRFNMRGVGHSEGEFAHGQGECDDLLAVIAWLSKQPSITKVALAGFSFGSYVSYAAACQTPVEFLISVAPPVARFPFHQHRLSATPWLVIQGDEDDVVAPAIVYDWIATLSSPPQLRRLPTAGHFFHGHLLELRQMVIDFYQQHHTHDA